MPYYDAHGEEEEGEEGEEPIIIYLKSCVVAEGTAYHFELGEA
jgi:hypothetical protein